MTAATRFKAHWPLKLGLSLGLGLLFWTGYGLLGRHAVFPLRGVPVTWLDRSIPFQPEPWGWIYLSQFLLTGLLPWLMTDREEIRRFAASVGWLSGASFLIFFLFPVASPRPLFLTEEAGAMRLILDYDGPLNAFPSLHAGFLILLARLAWRIFPAPRSRLAVLGGCLWGAAILYATLATRQHYALDLVAGAGLGVLADWLAWRSGPRARVVATTRRSSGVMAQAGCK